MMVVCIRLVRRERDVAGDAGAVGGPDGTAAQIVTLVRHNNTPAHDGMESHDCELIVSVGHMKSPISTGEVAQVASSNIFGIVLVVAALVIRITRIFVVSVTRVFTIFHRESRSNIGTVIAQIPVFMNLERVFSDNTIMIHVGKTSYIIEDIDISTAHPRLTHVHGSRHVTFEWQRIADGLHVTHAIHVLNGHTFSSGVGIPHHIFFARGEFCLVYDNTHAVPSMGD